MRRPRAAGAILLLALMPAFVLLHGCGCPDTPEPAEDADAAGEADAAAETAASGRADAPTAVEVLEDSSVTPLKRYLVEVYFPSAVDDGLIGEYREIFETSMPGDRVKQIIADLISGPVTADALPALPPSTELRQVYVLADGVAYLDFSGDLADGVGGGSMSERLTVYAIVNSVALNVSEVRRVAVVIDGKPVETLNGHTDLRRPLTPNYSLILAPTVVRKSKPDRNGMLAAALPAADDRR